MEVGRQNPDVTLVYNPHFFIKKRDNATTQTEFFYASVDEFWRKEDKYRFLDSKENYSSIEWQPIEPDSQYTWLTQGLRAEFETFVSMGNKVVKSGISHPANVIFKSYSRGINTSRDTWVYNFNRDTLIESIKKTIANYNAEVLRWKHRENRDVVVDDFVAYDDAEISWSESLKQKLQRGKRADFSASCVRRSLYRPFTKSNVYFARTVVERVYVFPSIFPSEKAETQNRAICVTAIGNKKPFHCLATHQITDVHLTGDSQCFPFYTYDEDGTNRRENITDWALAQFRTHYCNDKINKWDIFYYVYGILHHPTYRERYAANLKRDLPRLPYAPDFRGFANAGARLAEIHIGYEDVDEYQGGNDAPVLQFIETPDVPLDWRVDKMKLSKDKTQLKYNDYLTLDGIPSKAFDYRLGNRSALEWVIDQYRVKTDTRSGIVNDPNRDDDPQYIISLIRKVITVSLETVSIVENLPELGVE